MVYFSQADAARTGFFLDLPFGVEIETLTAWAFPVPVLDLAYSCSH
jgi:hypothetical protein